VRLLYDAVLPHSLSLEAPAGADFVRWDGADVSDTELARVAAEKGYRAVVLLGRDSLEQKELRDVAREVGVALVAAATDNPFEAKRNILKNLDAVHKELANHEWLLVFASEVRPDPIV
jgi:hypothetical protein